MPDDQRGRLKIRAQALIPEWGRKTKYQTHLTAPVLASAADAVVRLAKNSSFVDAFLVEVRVGVLPLTAKKHTCRCKLKFSSSTLPPPPPLTHKEEIEPPIGEGPVPQPISLPPDERVDRAWLVPEECLKPSSQHFPGLIKALLSVGTEDTARRPDDIRTLTCNPPWPGGLPTCVSQGQTCPPGTGSMMELCDSYDCEETLTGGKKCFWLRETYAQVEHGVPQCGDPEKKCYCEFRLWGEP